MEHSSAPVASRTTPPPGIGMIFLLGALTASSALSIDIYLPAIPAIAGDFGTSVGHVQRSLSAYFIGMALGQLFYGPLSDRIGRRTPLLAGAALGMAAALLSGFSPSADRLIAARFLEALGGCAGVVIGRAVVSDRYDARDAARIFSMLMLVLGIAPLLAPMAGAILLDYLGWRAIFVAIALFFAAQTIAVALWLPETRTRAMQTISRAEKVITSYKACLTDRKVLGFVLAGACNGGAFFTYLATSPALFISHYGLSPRAFSLIFALNSAGLIIGSQVNRWLLLHYSPQTLVRTSALFAFAAGTLFVATVLAGLARVEVAILLLFLALSTYALISGNCTALALARMPQRGGAISALLGSAMFGVGGLISAAATALPVAPPLRVALVLLAGFGGMVAALHWLAGIRQWRA